MAALLLRRELVLEVHTGGAGLDHLAHQLVGVERSAEAGLGVRDDRRHPVAIVAALGELDLVGTAKRVRDATDDGRHAVRRVQALIGVDLLAEVRVRRHLPAAQVDRLESGSNHLHGLAAGHRPECSDVRALVQEPPQALGALSRERVLDVDAAAQAYDLVGGVRALDAREARGEDHER